MRGHMIRTLAITIALAVSGVVGTGCRKPAPTPPSATEVQEFQSALNDGDAAIVDRLLSAKPGLVHVRDAQERTPLAIAKLRDDTEMEQVIRRHGGKE